MVALARAVSIDARVVVMDEPTSSLEPREVDSCSSGVVRLRERGIAVVYVSHRLDELYRVCDGVTVLRDGVVVHTGALADLDRLRARRRTCSAATAPRYAAAAHAAAAAHQADDRRRAGAARSTGSPGAHQLHDVVVRRAARRGGRPRRPARRRPQRDRSRRSPARCRWTPARSTVDGRRLRPARPPAARPGRHRDAARGPQGRGHHPGPVGAREHRARRAAPAQPGRAGLRGPHRHASSTRS